jgi:Uma2 family endonuclease
MAVELPIRPITVDEYHRMVEAGIIEEDERVELLDGMLVKMPPIGLQHGITLVEIVVYLKNRIGTRAVISGEVSIPIAPHDEPQPDIGIFRREILAKKSKADWEPRDILSLIEISDTTLGRDTGAKRRAYARGKIADYLIVDLTGRRIIRHRNPREERYTLIEDLLPPHSFALDAMPDVALEVAAFFRAP